MMLRFQGLGVDPEQIRHQFGGVTIGLPEMLRCAKSLGLKARVAATTWARLVNTPMPSLAPLKNGGFLLLGSFFICPGGEPSQPFRISKNLFTI